MLCHLSTPNAVPKQLKGLAVTGPSWGSLGQALWFQGAPHPLQQTWAAHGHFFGLSFH